MDPSESHSLAPSSSDHPIEGILKLLIVVKDTAGGHSDRLGSRFLDAAHRHTEMIITMTPWGARCSMKASAIWAVRRS